ncbi:hypothetical protein [Thioalkalivibrio sp. ARh3]|uniref:hypothetical protein n=1 Tax=Thioalkalivibrio sp. ARh3 TaxID=1158148 RepID=UPI00038102DC|nr:hypothetical protein [Thioalkalivibrio sp. ARh3]
MSYPCITPYIWNLGPEDDTERDELEAAKSEISSDSVALLEVIRDGDWDKTVDELITEAAESRIANRKQLAAEDEAERRALA